MGRLGLGGAAEGFRGIIIGVGLSMLPHKSLFYAPTAIHCPLDHLRMTFRSGAYRCNWPGCPMAYSMEKGYHRVGEEGDAKKHEELYALEAICMCDRADFHQLYIGDFAAGRKVRFWVCPVRGCGYEVSQRLEKTETGWRTVGSFEHTSAVRLKR
jgi:hypothetical protein